MQIKQISKDGRYGIFSWGSENNVPFYILDKSAKTEAEHQREQLLVDQCVFLTEEQEYVMVPAPGSGVPGAPADNEPPEGMEQHSPVLFLDLNSDDLSTGTYLPTY